MASITITTNAKHDAALARLVERVNVERAAQDPPRAPITADQYVQNRVKDMLDSYVAQDDEETTQAPIRARLVDATPTQRQQIKTILGLP